ncbi:MAG: cbb3-type cytochrome c oxidase subunit I [Chloroflexota bacterium]
MASIALPPESAVTEPTVSPYAREERVTALFVGVAIAAVALGILLGFLQALEHAGIDLYPYLSPIIHSYYQGLTLHGVLNALVWTTFFICGFLLYISVQAYQRPLTHPALAEFTFGMMIVGLVMAAIPMLLNEATVMFTFYPPLLAHWTFYLGLTLVVAGTWLVTVLLGLLHVAWRKEHPGERMPLPAFMSIATFAMWTIASTGIALEMIFFNLPLSLGVIEQTNPIIARTLFWLTGHPIVYFWLLPAYVSWYTLVPRQSGGKLFSDPMARISFIMFLVLSSPIGLHHQFTDPGISSTWKLVHAFGTFAVFFPSLLTFFNVVASLENAGRNRGGRGWIGWIFKLPWNDPTVTPQYLAMMLFAFGGIGGLINASYQVNLAIHNTAWIVGHFHLTVGAAVTLSFMSISYWLLPRVLHRQLWAPKLAMLQGWLWFGGMIIFSNALHRLGLLDMPRRTAIGMAPYMQQGAAASPVVEQWKAILPLVAIGGTILTISGVLYILVCVMTAFFSRRVAEPAGPLEFAESQADPSHSPPILDQWRPWVALAIVLILVAYGPTLLELIASTDWNAPGRRVW